MTPARMSAGTIRGRMNVSIEMPFLAPTRGSPGSLMYATIARTTTRPRRTNREGSNAERIAPIIAYGRGPDGYSAGGRSGPEPHRRAQRRARGRGRGARRRRVEWRDGAVDGRGPRRRPRPDGRRGSAAPAGRRGPRPPPRGAGRRDARGPRAAPRDVAGRPARLARGPVRAVAGCGRPRRGRAGVLHRHHGAPPARALPRRHGGDRPLARLVPRSQRGARYDRRQG